MDIPDISVDHTHDDVRGAWASPDASTTDPTGAADGRRPGTHAPAGSPGAHGPLVGNPRRIRL